MTESFAAGTSEIKAQNTFLARVYGWMALALVISGITAVATALYEQMNPQAFAVFFRGGFFVVAIAEFVLVIALSRMIRRISVGTAAAGFLAYSVLNGITLSTIFFVYQLNSIISLFGVSACMFIAMAAYGSRTKENLMSFGKFFFMALIGLLLASVVNLLLHSSGLEWLISIAAVVLFTGLSAYDAQKMMIASRHAQDNEVFKKASIIGALDLYLDFINIFLRMLYLFGKRR